MERLLKQQRTIGLFFLYHVLITRCYPTKELVHQPAVTADVTIKSRPLNVTDASNNSQPLGGQMTDNNYDRHIDENFASSAKIGLLASFVALVLVLLCWSLRTAYQRRRHYILSLDDTDRGRNLGIADSLLARFLVRTGQNRSEIDDSPPPYDQVVAWDFLEVGLAIDDDAWSDSPPPAYEVVIGAKESNQSQANS